MVAPNGAAGPRDHPAIPVIDELFKPQWPVMTQEPVSTHIRTQKQTHLLDVGR